jgi:cyclopropane fatty-acyl-phospholipid synthase-like methyltransferase
VDLLAPKPGERILDLGCGDGVLTKKLADLGCEVVAVDSSVPQIEAARKLGLNAFAISGEDLPYEGEFDAVFQGFSDEDRSDYLQEVRTVLEPQLRDADGYWVADYVRLRFAATKARD